MAETAAAITSGVVNPALMASFPSGLRPSGDAGRLARGAVPVFVNRTSVFSVASDMGPPGVVLVVGGCRERFERRAGAVLVQRGKRLAVGRDESLIVCEVAEKLDLNERVGLVALAGRALHQAVAEGVDDLDRPALLVDPL